MEVSAEGIVAGTACVALMSKGFDKEFVRGHIYKYLLAKHWLCIQTKEMTKMFRGRREVWAIPTNGPLFRRTARRWP